MKKIFTSLLMLKIFAIPAAIYNPWASVADRIFLNDKKYKDFYLNYQGLGDSPLKMEVNNSKFLHSFAFDEHKLELIILLMAGFGAIEKLHHVVYCDDSHDFSKIKKSIQSSGKLIAEFSEVLQNLELCLFLDFIASIDEPSRGEDLDGSLILRFNGMFGSPVFNCRYSDCISSKEYNDFASYLIKDFKFLRYDPYFSKDKHSLEYYIKRVEDRLKRKKLHSDLDALKEKLDKIKWGDKPLIKGTDVLKLQNFSLKEIGDKFSRDIHALAEEMAFNDTNSNSPKKDSNIVRELDGSFSDLSDLAESWKEYPDEHEIRHKEWEFKKVFKNLSNDLQNPYSEEDIANFKALADPLDSIELTVLTSCEPIYLLDDLCNKGIIDNKSKAKLQDFMRVITRMLVKVSELERYSRRGLEDRDKFNTVVNELQMMGFNLKYEFFRKLTETELSVFIYAIFVLKYLS